jgi:hypothetical protein
MENKASGDAPLAIVVVLLGVVAIAAGLFWWFSPGRHVPSVQDTLKTEIALQIGLTRKEAAWLFLNLPPSENCYPGTIVPSRGQAFVRPVNRSMIGSLLNAGQMTPIKIKDSVDVGADDSFIGQWLSGRANFTKKVQVSIEMSGLQVVNMTSWDALMQRVKEARSKASEEERALFNKDKDIMVITRSYQGPISIRVTSEAAAGADVASTVPGFELKSANKGSGVFEYVLTSTEPVVFAFQAAKIDYLSGAEAATAELADLVLKPLKSDNASPWEVEKAIAELRIAPSNGLPQMGLALPPGAADSGSL